MGRTYRKRRKRQQLPRNSGDFCKIINLQKSLRLKCSNVQIDYFDNIGWGMKSKKKIDEGDIIISLPLNSLITVDVQCEIFSLIRKENQSSQFVLSVFLVYESHLKNNSRYFAYISCLPKSFTNLYFCTENEVKQLPNFLKQEFYSQSSFIEKIFHQLFQFIYDKQCPHCGENLKNIYSRRNFIWAWFVVNTRSVYYEDEKHRKSLALAPFLDMFNHSGEAVTKMSIDFEQGLYNLRTLVKYKKFEQVFIKYGPHSNLKLLLEYGFILPENPHDSVEFTFQEVVDTVKEFDHAYGDITKPKHNFIKSNKLNQYLNKRADFSWNFNVLISVLITANQNFFHALQSKVYLNTFTSEEKNIIKKISQMVSEKKYKEMEQNLQRMEGIDKCTESFQLAKKLIEIYMSFLG